MSNVTEIPSKPDAMIAALENIKRNLPALIEYQGAKAQIQKSAYDAYLKQGFTEDQAILLCSKVI